VPLVLLHVRNDESKIRRHQALRRQLIAALGATGEAFFFLDVGYEGELLYILEVLIERGGGGRAHKTSAVPTFDRCRHGRSTVGWSAQDNKNHTFGQQPCFVPNEKK
jgi:hypothetical protein